MARIALRRMARRVRADAQTPEFGRLLLFQALGAGGDALVALALAGTLFFSVPETEARGAVVRYLLLTMAPLAIVAPVLARYLDRHRSSMRVALVAAAAGRGLLTWWMSTRLDSLLLFPLAFGVLVLSRAGLIVRGAILPRVLPRGRSLVNANASLSRAAAVSGMLALIPGVVLLRWPGPGTELIFAAIVYAAGMIPAVRLPGERGRRPHQATLEARAAMRSVSIRQSLVAAAGMRMLVGFLVIHLAFSLRREDFGSVGIGLLVGAAAFGGLSGALVAPRLRRRLREEGILAAALVLAGTAALAAGAWFSPAGAGVLIYLFGLASGAAKVAFDAIVQRESPEAARGWAFARFESILQLAWVIGAFVPLLPSIPAGLGVFGAGFAANLLALVFLAGRHRVRTRQLRGGDPPA